MCPEGGLEENEKVDAPTKPASWRREAGETSSVGDVAMFYIDS